jgi:hypothetical protein
MEGVGMVSLAHIYRGTPQSGICTIPQGPIHQDEALEPTQDQISLPVLAYLLQTGVELGQWPLAETRDK